MANKYLKSTCERATYRTSDKDWRVSLVPKLVKDGRVLDVGCNNGAVASRLKRKQNEVFGIDLISDLCVEAKQRGIEVVCADAGHLPFREAVFDCITMTEIVEHLIFPERAIEEARRSLRSLGELIITVPNVNSLYNRISVMLGRMGSLDNPEHLRVFNADKICAMLCLRGFKILIKKSSPSIVPLVWSKIQIPFFSLGDSVVIKAAKLSENMPLNHGTCYPKVCGQVA